MVTVPHLIQDVVSIIIVTCFRKRVIEHANQAMSLKVEHLWGEGLYVSMNMGMPLTQLIDKRMYCIPLEWNVSWD